MKNGIERYRDNLQGEIDGAYLYEALAKSEPDPKLAEVCKRLASVERRHAKVWADMLGVQVPPVLEPGWRTRTLGWLSKELESESRHGCGRRRIVQPCDYLKMELPSYILHSRFLVFVTAPVIYLGFIPF